MITEWTEPPVTIPRLAFARWFGQTYQPGEHVVFAGPTQASGKTQLGFDLLAHVATPELPAYVAVSKPRDRVTQHYMEKLNWRLVRDWPPSKRMRDYFQERPSGFVVWPPYGDIYEDDERASEITERLIRDRYTSGVKGEGGILVMDDTMVKSKILHLDKPMVTVLAMAGAMDLSLWVFVQKPTDSGQTSVWAFTQAQHRFFFRTDEDRARDRYTEIVGADPRLVEQWVTDLKPRQALYYGPGPTFAIVDSDSPEGKIR